MDEEDVLLMSGTMDLEDQSLPRLGEQKASGRRPGIITGQPFRTGSGKAATTWDMVGSRWGRTPLLWWASNSIGGNDELVVDGEEKERDDWYAVGPRSFTNISFDAAIAFSCFFVKFPSLQLRILNARTTSFGFPSMVVVVVRVLLVNKDGDIGIATDPQDTLVLTGVALVIISVFPAVDRWANIFPACSTSASKSDDMTRLFKTLESGINAKFVART